MGCSDLIKSRFMPRISPSCCFTLREQPVYLMFALRFLTVYLISLAYAEDFPTCGDCWCSTDDNGTGPCPDWAPQTSFSNETISVYLSQKPSSIFTLNCNPYSDSTCSTVPAQSELDNDEAVCAYVYPFSDGQTSCSSYSMVTFASRAAAESAGAVVTHLGSCGLCSTTQDLAIYLSMLLCCYCNCPYSFFSF